MRDLRDRHVAIRAWGIRDFVGAKPARQPLPDEYVREARYCRCGTKLNRYRQEWESLCHACDRAAS